MLNFLRSDVFGLKFIQPRVQVLAGAPFPDIRCHINRGMAAEGQPDGIAGSGINGACDAFVLKIDGGEIGAALHVRDDDSFCDDSQVFAEAPDQIMAHGARRDRGVQRSPDRLAFRSPDPDHKIFGRSIGT